MHVWMVLYGTTARDRDGDGLGKGDGGWAREGW